MDNILFSFSNEKVKEIKKRFLTLQIAIPILMPLFFIFNPEFSQLNLQIQIFVFVATLFLIELILLIQPRIMLKKFKERSIIANSSFIEISDGKFSEKIQIEDIKKIQITSDQNDKISAVKINTIILNKRIDYVDNLSKLVDLIKNSLPENAEILQKKTNTIWQNPLMFLPLMLLTTLTIIYIKKVGGQFSYDLFNGFLMTLVGSYLLILKPISKHSGMRFRKLENILGYTIIVCGLMLLTLLIFK